MNNRPEHLGVARLAFAARAIDLMISMLLAKVIWLRLAVFFPEEVRRSFDLSVIVSLIVAILLHLFITQFVFADRSIGKMCMGLKTVDPRTNDMLTLGGRLRLFISKIVRFGLDTFKFNSLPSSSLSDGVQIVSDLYERPSSPAGPGKRGLPKQSVELVVLTGRDAGQTLYVGETGHWFRGKPIKIGRDNKWADLCMPQSANVSRRHALVRYHSGHWEVADHSVSGNPSTHGTYVNGRRLGSSEWMKIRRGERIQLADVEILFGR